MQKIKSIIKIFGLCLALVLLSKIVQGAFNVNSITLTATSPTSVIYGPNSQVTYNMVLTTNGGGQGTTFTITCTGLPSNATYSPTSITITNNNPTIHLTITNNDNSNPVKYSPVGGPYNFTVTVDSKNATSNYTITKRTLSVTGTFTTQNKIYDGNTLAPVNVTNLTWTGLVSGDDVSLAYNFADKNVGTGKPITCSITGTDAPNYSFTPPSLTARDITPKSLTLTGATITPKVYDGTTTATITGGTLQGLVGTETVTLTRSGNFADKNAGTGKSVTANCSISGTGSNNYTLTQPTGLIGNITPKPLTVSGATVIPKVFDGTTIATITGGSLVGVISPDVVDLTQAGTFASANVGIGISVTSNCLISGTDAGNYTLTQPTGLTGNITAPTAVSWNGGTSTDWVTTSNWTPPYLPDATIDVTVPSTSNNPIIAASTEATCNNLSISAGSLTISAGAQLTVTGETAITPVNGLIIESDPETGAGTGSFITKTTSGTGSAKVIRYMSPKRWHLVSSPLSEQAIGEFLTSNQSIPKNIALGAPTVYPFERGMRAYKLDGTGWDNFLLENSAEKLTTGKGFSMRVKGTTGNQRVTFIGKLQPGLQTVTVIPDKWNCIGNPYTSAIGIKTGSGSTTDFLATNAANLDPLYGAIYVWNQPSGDVGEVEAAGSYQTISNATLSNSAFPVSADNKVQQGQAFMVKMSLTANTVSFTSDMQVHNTALALKSTEDIWPTIQLSTTADSINSSTVIAFHDGMTNGLDPTYDAGLLKSGGSMELYTRLVDDYGIPFDIQALPSDQYDQLIIPVGVDYSKGGMVSFSAQGMYLPSSCRPILEDRLAGIFTDLSDKTYTAELSANTAGTGRFFLHTSYTTTGTVAHDNAQELKAWTVGNQEINITGKVSNGAMASLYDIQGRLIVTHAMREVICNRISLPSLKPGVYLLQVRDQQKIQTLKVNIGQ